jgi:hypothetical protein
MDILKDMIALVGLRSIGMLAIFQSLTLENVEGDFAL